LDLTAVCLSIPLSLIVVAAFASAVTGRDIKTFERLRASDPKRYYGMKRVMKVNGPLVALMCIAFVTATPLAVLAGDIPWVIAIVAIAGASGFLWLSLRWTLWAYR